MRLEDATGSGTWAKVDQLNRVAVSAVQASSQVWHMIQGDSYLFGTGNFILTDTTPSAIFYLKNNEIRDFVITTFAVAAGPSTGDDGTAMPSVTMIRNPTGGTIISDATEMDQQSNNNFGSTNVVDVNAYEGAQGKTLTGGTTHALFPTTTNTNLWAAVDLLLPKASSIGVTLTPPAGNTSMFTRVGVIGYLQETT